MRAISLENAHLTWVPQGAGTSVVWPLEDLRLAYLVLRDDSRGPSQPTPQLMDLDHLETKGFSEGPVQAIASSRTPGRRLRLLFKGLHGPALIAPCEELPEGNMDLFSAIMDTRAARLLRLAEWLSGNPSRSCHGMVFGLSGVHKNGRSTYWRDLDRVEIRRAPFQIPIVNFHFIPLEGSGSARIIHRLSPEHFDECLAEIDFWRRHASPLLGRAEATSGFR
jgi:hypothetical protein